MKILLTGAAGFIGSKVAELLLADGHEVAGLDDLNRSYDVRLKQWRLSQLVKCQGFSFQQLDISDRAALFAWQAGSPDASEQGRRLKFNAVINLAARAGVRQSVESPAAYILANVLGTLNLLDLCSKEGISKFVLASTSSLYGANNSCPFSEEANTDRPLSPYAASKKAAETLSYSYHHLHGIDVTILRYFTVYGPAGRPDMSLFRFVKWISEGQEVKVYGDGAQSRDFTYVDDVASGTIAGLLPLGYEIVNLGSDQPVKLNEAIAVIERLTGREARIKYSDRHPSDVDATWADIGKASRLFKWRPQVRFETGVERLVKWYRENRGWAKDIATD